MRRQTRGVTARYLPHEAGRNGEATVDTSGRSVISIPGAPGIMRDATYGIDLSIGVSDTGEIGESRGALPLLTPDDVQVVEGVPADDVARDDMDRCREVAGAAARLGAEAIRWASATGPGQSLAIFVEHLRPGSRVETVRAFELTRTRLRAIEEGALLATQLPELRDLPLIPQIVASDPTEPAAE